MCPKCYSSKRLVMNGTNKSGSRRLLCKGCGRSHTPRPKRNGKQERLRDDATRMYLSERSYRKVGKRLELNPQTIINWVRDRIKRDKWYAVQFSSVRVSTPIRKLS